MPVTVIDVREGCERSNVVMTCDDRVEIEIGRLLLFLCSS